jgi:hypothetical protein
LLQRRKSARAGASEQLRTKIVIAAEIIACFINVNGAPLSSTLFDYPKAGVKVLARSRRWSTYPSAAGP